MSLKESIDLLKRHFKEDVLSVNELISSLANTEYSTYAREIMNYANISNGKGLRYLLLLSASRILGYNGDKCIPLAAAVECIHAATLLHDDVIDASPIRRGMPSVHKMWGSKASILSGDYLFSNAFKMMVDVGSVEVLEMLSKTSIKIAEAEIWQLELLFNYNITYDQYISLIEGKTAALFAASCFAGAFIATQDVRCANDFYLYGLNFGIAFQIMDDMMDYFLHASKLGKPVLNDFLEGKITLPIIILLQISDSNEQRERIVKYIENKDLKNICLLLACDQIKEKCKENASLYINKAVSMIEKYRSHELYKILRALPQNLLEEI